MTTALDLNDHSFAKLLRAMFDEIAYLLEFSADLKADK